MCSCGRCFIRCESGPGLVSMSPLSKMSLRLSHV